MSQTNVYRHRCSLCGSEWLTRNDGAPPCRPCPACDSKALIVEPIFPPTPLEGGEPITDICIEAGLELLGVGRRRNGDGSYNTVAYTADAKGIFGIYTFSEVAKLAQLTKARDAEYRGPTVHVGP